MWHLKFIIQIYLNIYMVLILKKSRRNVYKIIKLSANGYSRECRISDLLHDEICYDSINRIKFYRNIIDKLRQEGHNITLYQQTEVTNTMHDRIVNYFNSQEIEVYLIEVDEETFPYL